MYLTGNSDLSSMLRLQRFGSDTRSELSRAGLEVASGKKSDLVEATAGDLAPLFSLEKTLGRLAVRGQTISAAAARSGALQLNLENIQQTLAQYGTGLLAAVDLENQAQAFSIAGSARGAFDNMVGTLNAQYAGQALFAGAAVDGAALIDADTMYADITALTMAAPDGTAAIAAIDDYFFNPLGGFETTAFLGSNLDAPGAEISDGEVVDYAVRGDTGEIRDALRNVVLAAVAANGDHGGNGLDGMLMLRAAGNGAINAVDGLIGVRETLGHIEERFEDAAAQNLARKSMFEINRNAIIAADPYEAATRFKALEGQMEAVYMMTARLSGMRLQNYLR